MFERQLNARAKDSFLDSFLILDMRKLYEEDSFFMLVLIAKGALLLYGFSMVVVSSHFCLLLVFLISISLWVLPWLNLAQDLGL